jgi:hypothetical protein
MISAKGGILVVDDEAESLRLISSILTSAGYTVRAADNGGLALPSVVGRPGGLRRPGDHGIRRDSSGSSGRGNGRTLRCFCVPKG